jgi:hypothetical protein
MVILLRGLFRYIAATVLPISFMSYYVLELFRTTTSASGVSLVSLLSSITCCPTAITVRTADRTHERLLSAIRTAAERVPTTCANAISNVRFRADHTKWAHNRPVERSRGTQYPIRAPKTVATRELFLLSGRDTEFAGSIPTYRFSIITKNIAIMEKWYLDWPQGHLDRITEVRLRSIKE